MPSSSCPFCVHPKRRGRAACVLRRDYLDVSVPSGSFRFYVRKDRSRPICVHHSTRQSLRDSYGARLMGAGGRDLLRRDGAEVREGAIQLGLVWTERPT